MVDRSTIRWGQVGSGPLGPLLVGRDMSCPGQGWPGVAKLLSIAESIHRLFFHTARGPSSLAQLMYNLIHVWDCRGYNLYDIAIVRGRYKPT